MESHVADVESFCTRPLPLALSVTVCRTRACQRGEVGVPQA